MKKIISILITCAMFTALVPFAVSAAGSILFSDNFDSGSINEADWYPGAFTCENGGPTNSPHVEDWATGWHVLQSMYNSENGSDRTYGANVCFKVDAFAFDDSGNDASEHTLGLWWADYFDSTGDEGRLVYQFILSYEKRMCSLVVTGEGSGESYYPESTVLGEWAIPDSVACNMDLSDPSVINLGMRINGAQMDCFFNEQKVISFTTVRTTTGVSPILMTNGASYAGFDNFVVATADYDLFNEGENMNVPLDNAPAPANNGGDAAPADNGGNGAAPADNDAANGNSGANDAPAGNTPANTGATPTGGNAAKTGDAAIIVVAVMIAALGCAVAVKASARR